ncbi:hypothetical protein PYCC9005_002719 [Savitreella phatthalungensis]
MSVRRSPRSHAANSNRRAVKSEPDEESPKKRVKKEPSADDIHGHEKQPTNKQPRNKSPKKDLTSQKLAKLESYSQTPYPNYKRPTPAECKHVNDLLAKVHGKHERPVDIKIERSDGTERRGAACGEVPSVLDALVRTVLSQNTTSKNSMQAKRDMDAHFGGKEQWAKIDAAPVEELEDAIRVAGLAPSKSRTIKGILESIRQRKKEEGDDVKTEDPNKSFSLDYLHEMPDDACMRELVSHKGVGPKTASCVLLFCMKRASFAVDTHVFRLSKALGWVPPKCNSRDACYAHLDAHIPADLKYPLHTLLIVHGRNCARCSAHKRAGLTDAAKCPLKELSRKPSEEDELSDEDDEQDSALKHASPDVKQAVAKLEAMS